MRTFRILVGASFLFFCTTLMHAAHIGMQDPQICSNSLGPVAVFGNTFSFQATDNGTSTRSWFASESSVSTLAVSLLREPLWVGLGLHHRNS